MSLLVLLFALAACQPAPDFPDPVWPSPTPPTGQPVIFSTPTTTPSATPGPRPSPVFTHTPLPTPTPFVYVVRRGDTMLGIALFYGIELSALKAANPTVDPMIMSVGTQLIIPLADGPEVAAEPTSTPAPLTVRAPACFPTGDGGLWCSVILQNEAGQSVENISLLLDLVGPDGGLLASQVLYPPLNRLPAGGNIGVGALFPGLANTRVQAYASLLTAVLVGGEADRYREVEILGQQVDISPDHRQARFTGEVQVLGSAHIIWIAALGFDAQGSLVGLRKLVYDGACAEETLATPQPCAPITFEGALYSAGPDIVSVSLLVEARP